jgi:hypothetical protein
LSESINNGKLEHVKRISNKATSFLMLNKCTLIKKFKANSVLQVIKIRNIAVPKEKENSTSVPPLLKFTLTDGLLTCSCIALENIDNLG